MFRNNIYFIYMDWVLLEMTPQTLNIVYLLWVQDRFLPRQKLVEGSMCLCRGAFVLLKGVSSLNFMILSQPLPV